MYRNTYPPPPPPTSSGLPLPPPPPPPSSYGNERYDRPAQSSYPPPADGPSRQWNDHYTQQDRRDEHQFRGPYSDLRRNRQEDRRRNDGDYRDRDRDRDHDRDNYRPPQGDFTFRVEPPPGVESYESYRPRDRERDRDQHAPRANNYNDERTAPYQSRRNENGRQEGRNGRPRRTDDRRRQHNSYQPQQGTGYGRRGERREKTKPSARLLLLKKHDEDPELMLGDTKGRVTYRDVDELSDSDETEMDISDNSDTDVAEPVSKRARTSTTATAAEQEAPKWSNPDPYTALPPPDETSRKKKDMVQLIRKARVEAEAKKPAAQIEGLDFISCDFNDNDDKVRDLPSNSESKGQTRYGQESTTKAGAKISTLRDLRGATATTSPSTENRIASAESHTRNSTSHENSLGNKSNPIDLTASTSLGNRKRTFDDNIKSYSSSQKSRASGRPVKKMDKGGNILPWWLPKDEPCPWFKADHVNNSFSPGSRLHQEIVDFYLWVSPRYFEIDVRQQLIDRLGKAIRRKWPDVDLYAFGSYMSGMYLPTADMDIAVCSNSYVIDHIPKYSKRNHLFALQNYLRVGGFAEDDNVEVISKAKVPLVKFVDSLSFLKVDLSFEKMDGRHAIATFAHWKDRYPSMPSIVSLVKQFLLMRGLNEPVNGGIGGFSIMCMVVHLLDQLPQVQSGDMFPAWHLGDTLMEFFDYYGNHFRYKEVAIRVNPPGLIPKSEVRGFTYRNYDRLSIMDPNNPENDVSGGSFNTEMIINFFREAYEILKDRMYEVANGENPKDDPFGDSILGPLFGGDYTSFTEQRNRLRELSKLPKPTTESYNGWAEW
ncbi:uncharacterized protein GGS22DRAFT_90641 [Annulohypoxylon maeteangense]|uniref:uncharacterized protein n=1 Tax=Annulohypoxylon maeteangense TaxID=1927788 RepID=UPI002008AB8E|nr:uncharacterized protein GGS22DRAFT_90641 [Annulohypoxylon maeteangense]KAI0887931.1 hypothetical protein GGS22DRAFT_90641 [Annulohypoxylon maeteangense]